MEMQFTSDLSMNLLITLLVVILISCVCSRSCRRGGGAGTISGGSIGLPGISSSYVRGCGVVFIVLGMTFFYSFRYYGFTIAAPLLIIGMCLTVGSAIRGGNGRSSFAPPQTRSIHDRGTATPPRSEAPRERDDTLFRAARHAQENGLLEQRQDPYDSSFMIPFYRCPSCEKETDFRDVDIRGNGIVCAYCRHRVAF